MREKGISAVILPVVSLSLFFICCIVLNTSPDQLTGAAFCHQISSRSPSFNFPFCYRCSGLFFGVFFGFLTSFISGTPKKLFSRSVLIALFISLLLYLADILNSSKFPAFHLYPETVGLRFLSAYPLGFFMAKLFSDIITHLFLKKTQTQSRGAFVSILLFSACWGLSYLMIFTGSYTLSILSRAMLSLSAVFFLSSLYAVLFKCFSLWRNGSDRSVFSYLIGSSCALIQTALFGFIHLKYLPFEKIF